MNFNLHSIIPNLSILFLTITQIREFNFLFLNLTLQNLAPYFHFIIKNFITILIYYFY